MRLIDADAKTNAIYVSQFVIDQIQKIPPIDPVRAAGRCRCRECRFAQESKEALDWDETPLLECPEMPEPHRGYEFCSWSEPREAKDDG